MREIKFRAWDKSEKCLRNDIYKIEWAGGKPQCVYCQEYGDIGDFILTQYTGLKDKNGKEIYEGDILGGALLCGAVHWDNLRSKYVVQLTPEGWHDLPIISEMKEVVGNIYENPELLKNT